MPLALTSIDFGVIFLVLLGIGLIAAFFASGQKESEGFFSIRGGIGWFPAALSLAAALVGSGRMVSIIGDAYDYGWKCLAAIGGLFLATLLVGWLAHPLVNRLESGSLFEYLELRFDRRLRAVAAALAAVSLAIALVSMLASAAGWLAVMGFGLPVDFIVVAAALFGILLAAFGGLRGVIWSDVVLFLVVVGGGAALVLASLQQTTGGAAGVWQASIDFDRRPIIDLHWNPAEAWNIWLALPAWTIAWCAWLVTRPDIQQRWKAAGEAADARSTIFVEGLLGCGLLAGLIYAGLALLAFYQQDPQRLRPIWAANIFAETGRPYTKPESRQAPLLDPVTGQQRVAVSIEVIHDASGNPIVDPKTGEPQVRTTRKELLDPNDGTPLLHFYADDLTPQTLPEIVAQGRLIEPNTQEPYTSTTGLLDSSGEQIEMNRILVRRGAIAEVKRPEVALLQSSRPQLAPYFAAHYLPWGLQGLVAAALFGGLVCAFAAGLNAIGLVLSTDFYRRLGWGRGFIAAWNRKEEGALAEGDELSPLRWILAGIGLAIVAAAIGVGRGDNWLSLVASVAGIAGGPLLGVFLLGLFTRQATGDAALAGLAIGLVVSFWLMIGGDLARATGLSAVWPLGNTSDAIGVVAGFIATLLIGSVLSFFLGESRDTREIRGLVVALWEAEIYLPEKLPSGQEKSLPKIGPPQPPGRRSS